MDVLKKSFKLEGELKSSEIFRILQDVSAEHCNKYSLSMEDLGKKGLIWVVVRQYLEISRYPEAGETIEVSTWPGETRHMMFPRYYVIRDEKGESIMKASAVWSMLNGSTRELIIPQNYGLNLEALKTGEECGLPPRVKRHELSKSGSFTVPEEYIDANRHMNNTCYYDAAEKCLGNMVKGKHLKEAVTEYVSEAVLGEEVKLSWDEIEGHIFISGENNGTVFKMNLLYE